LQKFEFNGAGRRGQYADMQVTLGRAINVGSFSYAWRGTSGVSLFAYLPNLNSDGGFTQANPVQISRATGMAEIKLTGVADTASPG